MAYAEDSSISHEITNDARFRAWGVMVHSMLEAVGLVQTADTGQINWAAEGTLWPEATATDAGYEIWEFTDALQATRPIFIKLWYGKGTAVRARLGINVGNATSGTGNLQGGISTRRDFEANASSGFAAFGRIHVCYVGTALVLWASVNPAQSGGAGVNNPGGYFLVERLREADGSLRTGGVDAAFGANPFSNGLVAGMSVRSGASWSGAVSIRELGASPLMENTYAPALLLPYNATVGKAGGPLVSMMSAPGSGMSAGDTGKVELMGVERSYIREHNAQADGTRLLLRE